MVLYFDQFSTDIEKLPTESPLAGDTTFNIGEYLFTQTTYKKLSLIRKDTGIYPWFPGPVLIHRRQREQDFSFFCQSLLRGNSELRKMKLPGINKCEELAHKVYYLKTIETQHILGLKHVK